MSKRARKQTEKAAALQEERNRLNTKKAEKFKNKSSKKRSTQTGSSESEDSEPEARCKDYFAADVGHVRRRDSVVGSRSQGRARRREGRPRSAVGDEERERETRRVQKRN